MARNHFPPGRGSKPRCAARGSSVAPRLRIKIGVGLAEILEDARKDYDLIIIDSPPLLGFPEPLQMSALVDGVLLVARSGQTNRKALASAIATLNRLRANVIGIVMNEVRADTSDSYYYHYYHPKYYGKYKAA